jgi:hypothetical protein
VKEREEKKEREKDERSEEVIELGLLDQEEEEAMESEDNLLGMGRLFGDQHEILDVAEDEEDSSRMESLQVRAKEYIANKKEEEEKSREDYMAKLNINRLEYEAILRINKESLAPMTPEGTRGPAPEMGSFTSTQDMRQVAAGHPLCIIVSL